MLKPFDLDESDTYQQWRDDKLSNAISDTADLIVEVKNPEQLTQSEYDALQAIIQRSNMAIYATHAAIDESIIRHLGKRFGLERLDANWLAGEEGISSIRVFENSTRKHYIPYTNKPIKWHTDGYYNPPERKINAMLLHCVQSAASGGETRLLDHEIAYLMLRDENPKFIRALMQPDAMTIPERVDETDGIRAAQTGPVFSVDAQGNLHMRYTARTRSIEWKQDSVTLAAVSALDKLLASDIAHIHRVRLEPGMGLLCNNVLHSRSEFNDDDEHTRLLYRARYYDRISPVEATENQISHT